MTNVGPEQFDLIRRMLPAPPPPGPTAHTLLTNCAKSWLKDFGCDDAWIEKPFPGERVDAYGVRIDPFETVVIECKSSRSDLANDIRKACRRNGGVGTRRWYMVPDDLVERARDAEMVRHGWGVLSCSEDGRPRIIVESMLFKPAVFSVTWPRPMTMTETSMVAADLFPALWEATGLSALVNIFAHAARLAEQEAEERRVAFEHELARWSIGRRKSYPSAAHRRVFG